MALNTGDDAEKKEGEGETTATDGENAKNGETTEEKPDERRNIYEKKTKVKKTKDKKEKK